MAPLDPARLYYEQFGLGALELMFRRWSLSLVTTRRGGPAMVVQLLMDNVQSTPPSYGPDHLSATFTADPEKSRAKLHTGCVSDCMQVLYGSLSNKGVINLDYVKQPNNPRDEQASGSCERHIETPADGTQQQRQTRISIWSYLLPLFTSHEID